MKRSMIARLLLLTAALAISSTTGCKRKAQGPITPLPPARAGGSGIDNPRPSNPGTTSPNGANAADRASGLTDAGGAQGTDLTGGAGNSGLGTPTAPPNENVPFLGGPLDRSQFTEDRAQFASDVVLFDFDSAVVKTSEKEKLVAIATYLKANPATAVEVEGHCDERGTEEYNRSLGERRALALREELAQLGIDPKRVYTISYGEDRPSASGHDEASWTRNRRAESVLLTPR
jgi:peptidoglycan-associated lipoprotein